MAYTGGHTISNSFSFRLNNLSGETQTINMFELGASGDDVPVSVVKKEKAGVQIFNGYFTFSGEKTNKDITLNNYTTFTFKMSDATLIVVQCFQTNNLTLINSTINNRLQATDSGKYRNMSVQFEYVELQNSVNSFSLYAINNKNPLSLGETIIEIELNDAPFIGGIGKTDIDVVPFPTTDSYITPNFIEVQSNDGGGVQPNYSEILESQNGQVMDIAGVDLSVLNSNDAQQQMLGCLRFTKKDINGNDLEHFRCPVLDGYQYQNSYGFVGMETEADKFTLDGRTKFAYDLLGRTKLNIGYNYSSLPNLLQGSAYGKKQVAEQTKTIDNYKNVADKNRVIEVDVSLKDLKNVEIPKDLKNAKTPTNIKKKKQKTINPLLVFGGIVLLGIILNKK